MKNSSICLHKEKFLFDKFSEKYVIIVKLRKYSPPTRIIFYVFLGIVAVSIFFGLLSFNFVFRILFYIVCAIAFITIILVLPIAASNDNDKRKKGIIVDIPSTIYRLEQLFSISDSILIEDAAKSVELTPGNLLSFVSLHHNDLPKLRIDAKFIYVEKKASEVSIIEKDWVCPRCGKLNKTSQTVCAECNSEKLI